MSDLAVQLLRSSKFFTAEAARNAIAANEGAVERWQLALFHVVTALEHSSKALLARMHPVFVREKFESAQKTVGIERAFERISDKEIVGISFSEKDRSRIQAAIQLRNDIAHGSSGQNTRALEAKFFEVFHFNVNFFVCDLMSGLTEYWSKTN